MAIISVSVQSQCRCPGSQAAPDRAHEPAQTAATGGASEHDYLISLISGFPDKIEIRDIYLIR